MRTCPNPECKNIIDNDNAKFCKKCGCELALIPTAVHEEEDEDDNKNYIQLQKSNEGIKLSLSRIESLDSNHTDDVVLNAHNSVSSNLSHKQHELTFNNISLIKAVKVCYTKYVKFEGRATRSEYWYFWLFNFLTTSVPIILAFIIDKDAISMTLVCLGLLTSIASFLPMLSVTVRRLHDVGKSGAYFFISFIPCIGSFVLLYFLCKKSQ